MDNNINSISFNARLKIKNRCINKDTYFKNLKRLRNIENKFSKETLRFADDKYSFVLSKADSVNEEPMMSMKICNSKSGISQSGNKFITKGFDEYLETMTDKQIAKQFAKIFRVIFYKNVLLNKLPKIKSEYEKAVKTISTLKPEVTTNAEKQLVDELNVTIIKLKEQYTNINNKVRSKLKNLTKDDEKLKEFVGNLL